MTTLGEVIFDLSPKEPLLLSYVHIARDLRTWQPIRKELRVEEAIGGVDISISETPFVGEFPSSVYETKVWLYLPNEQLGIGIAVLEEMRRRREQNC